MEKKEEKKQRTVREKVIIWVAASFLTGVIIIMVELVVLGYVMRCGR